MRSATLFLLVIFTPCALLCWVSWSWMQEEESRTRRNQTVLYQQSVDTAARAASEFVTGQLRTFGETVDRMLAAESPADLRLRFNQAIRSTFPLAEAGLVLDPVTGRILPQVEPSEQAVTAFVAEHSWFFQEEMQPLFIEVPAYDSFPGRGQSKLTGHPSPLKPLARGEIPDAEVGLDSLAKEQAPPPPAAAPVPAPAPVRPSTARSAAPSREMPPAGEAAGSGKKSRAPADMPAPDAKAETPAPAEKAEPAAADSRRTVNPQISAPAEPSPRSTVKPVFTRLATLIHDHDMGIVSHPYDDRLFTLLWYRPPSWPDLTFAVALQPEALQKTLASQLAIDSPDKDTCLALLDHRLRPAVRWPAGTSFEPPSWGAPLVAREVGAVMPRWEATVYLCDPAIFNHAASASRWRLGIIVTTASLAAIVGAFFILRDARRAARDARLKTDFVSNVSHELKTPLTSIRMFSDLLGSNPSVPPEKTKRYADVIASEAARLTRLINNVLNFSRMESGRHDLKPASLDLRALTVETMEHMRPQLEKDRFEVEVNLPAHEVTIHGDGDALSQVLLNLLSNAGKYGIAPDLPRSVTVTLTLKDGHAVLSVADRGPGIPRGQERRVFEKFQRAHNTLASGTAGSGLGLTIARRLVEAHKGTLIYTPRDGGGAEFIVTLRA